MTTRRSSRGDSSLLAPSRAPGREGTRDMQALDAAWLEQRAVDYAARWESSAAGVQRLLERKVRERCERTGESGAAVLDEIQQVVSRLVERGYVDDRRFASQSIERLRKQGRSSTQIRARLRAKGVPDPLLDELLHAEQTDTEERAAWRLARRRRLGPYCDDPELRKHHRDRHLAVLGRQGFDFEMAQRIIDAPTTLESV